MSRIFLSHSRQDDREAVALKQWLVEQDPPLATDIFLDLDRRRGIRQGTRWKDALREANARCEAVICRTLLELGSLLRVQDRIPDRRNAEQTHFLRPAGATDAQRRQLGMATGRFVR